MKVLIADDDPVARRLLATFVSKWGEQVVEANDGAAAWRLFQDNDCPVVITDWMMPEVDGLELIRRIRTDPRPGYVYVILLTSLAQKADLVQGMEAGADDFLTKPFDREELRVRLRQGQRVVTLERSLAEQNRALREAQAALVQQEKLASLGQLAAGMAHEINNPVAYVSNNLTVLRRDAVALLDVAAEYQAGRAAEAERQVAALDLPYVRETLPRLFDTSLDGLRRVREIVRNLRDFARLDEAEFKEVDLNAALASTAEVLHHELSQRRVELRTDFGELPPVPCHPGKINQVFLNVLRNAAQASIPGGIIEVRTRAQDDGVVVEIEDYGCGIQPEHLPHIFEPFFTTRPVGQGMGLGLSVAYGVLRDHGGTIEGESTPGGGSVFRIRLPLRPPPQ
jgi:two-component system, NtrC family, sensor kinase